MQLRNGLVQTDDLQRTSVPEIFCAGEPTGVGGLELALVEGQIAGLAAGGRSDSAQLLFAARKKMRSFARALDRTFALRRELRRMPVLRQLFAGARMLRTRALRNTAPGVPPSCRRDGEMGPWQGRVCGPATHFLFDWSPDSVRPPIFPTRF